MRDLDVFQPRAMQPGGSLASIARRLLREIAARGAAANTVNAYRTDLEQLVGFLYGRDVVEVRQVTTRDVDDWVLALIEGEGMSRRTAGRKVASARRLFKYALKRDLIGRDPTLDLEPVRFESEPVIAPPSAKIRELLDAIPERSLEDIRDRALFRLMYDAALRVSGVLSLDVPEPSRRYTVDLETGVVTYRQKGRAVGETLFTSEATRLALVAWLVARREFTRSNAPNPALFLTRRNTRLSRAGAAYQLKKHGERVGLPEITCHQLRHRRIGEVYEQSDVSLANYLAGHKHRSTTVNIYGGSSRQRLRHRLRNEAPLGGEAADG